MPSRRANGSKRDARNAPVPFPKSKPMIARAQVSCAGYDRTLIQPRRNVRRRSNSLLSVRTAIGSLRP